MVRFAAHRGVGAGCEGTAAAPVFCARFVLQNDSQGGDSGAKFSAAAFLVALGLLLQGVGSRNLPQVYTAITALIACTLPSVWDWFQPDPPAKPS